MPACVSVIIPAYNCAPFLPRTVESALAQASPEIEVEVIVVDDGSKDDTAQVMQSFAGRVQYLRKANGGVSSARNAGIRMARGDYLYFLDADDVLAEGWFAYALQEFARSPEVGVVHGCFHRWEAGADADPALAWRSLSAKQAELADQRDLKQTGWVYHQMLLNSWVLCSAAMVRRQWVEQAGVFEEGVPMGEDWNFWLRVSRQCPFVKMQRTAVLYRQHPTQATRKLRPISYSAKLIVDAVQEYGLQGPDGTVADRAKVHAVIAQHQAWHALDHFQAGSWRTGVHAVWQAIRYQPGSLKHWRLLLLALLGLARPYARRITGH